MFALLMLPNAGKAAMAPLTDVELNDVTGQAGISAMDTVDGVTRMTFDNHFDNIPVMNGLLNFGDVTIQGAIETRNNSSMTVSQLTNSTLTGLTGMGGIMGFGMAGLGGMSVGTHYIDTTIDINRLSIGAIRVGQDLTGPSLGSLDILGLHATVQGTISISMH
jgi:hypothetical protein